MLEARAFVGEIETARKILVDKGAIFKGEYICRDLIFAPPDASKGLKDEFLRLRINEKNIWNEGDVIVALKKTEQKEVGKNSLIPFKKEFSSESEARKYIEENFEQDFQYDFEFTRTGWQYDLGENQVDLEQVHGLEHCFSIEVKSNTEEGLRELLRMLHIDSTIDGPSVIEMKRLFS